MIVKLLTEHHLEFLILKGGCKGSSEPTLVKIPLCLKSHVTAHIKMYNTLFQLYYQSGWKILSVQKVLTLALLNPDLSFFENTVDPDQLASEEDS